MSPAETSDSQGLAASKSAPGSNDSASLSYSHLRFGLYEVDLQKYELHKGGLKLKIPHQSFQILALLLQNPGAVVSRETLRQELWPSDVFVNFEGSLNSAVQKLRSVLQDTSRKPRYIETLPREGYRFIAKIEPLTPVATEAQADVTANDSAESLADLPPAGERPVDEPSEEFSAPKRNLRWWAAATVLGLIVLTAIYSGYRYNRSVQVVKHIPPQPSPAAPVSIVPVSQVRRSVAIIGFSNVSGDPRNRWLSTAFTEMLATELAAGDHLRTVAAEDVTRAKFELSLPSEDSYAPDTLLKIHKDLGCDYVLTGSYLAVGQGENGNLRLDVRAQDAVNGDTIASVAVVGSKSGLFDLASRAGEQIRAKLGAGRLTETELEEVKISLPTDPEAARLYSEGLAKLRVYDDVEASHLFEKVIRLQPDYAPAYSGLASSWSALGYDAKAAIQARKAMDLSQNLPERTRLETEARYYKINADWTREIEAYSRLQALYPDDLDYGINIALAQLAMGKSMEAATTTAALQKLASLEHNDLRIELIKAGIAGDLADYAGERTLAEDVARKAETGGQRLLIARAEMIVGYAAIDLGDFKGAKQAFAIAQRIWADSGDEVGAALAKMDIGISLEEEGDFAGARSNCAESLAVFRRKGDQASTAAALTNLSEIYTREGDLPRAERMIRETMVISSRLNRMRKLDLEKGNLAGLLQRQGKFREAKDILEPLLPHLRSAGEKSFLGSAQETLGSIAEDQGNMLDALSMYQEAAALFKDSGDKTEYARANLFLGKTLLRKGDFVSAKQALSDALSVDRAIGAQADADLGEVELAELSMEQGAPVDVTALRLTASDLRGRKIQDSEIAAQVVLVRELIREGKTSEAASVLREATALSAKCYDPTLRFDVALAAAEVKIAENRFADARREIRHALTGAAAIGCVRCRLEAQLKLGETEVRAGDVERGRAQLRQLADEATKRGFLLIAQQAAAYSAGPG